MSPIPSTRRRKCGLRHGVTLRNLLLITVPTVFLGSLLWSAFAEVRGKVQTSQCYANANQLASAVRMYSNDYDETLPLAEGWSDGVCPYLKGYLTFRCPADADQPDDPETKYSSFAFFAPQAGRRRKAVQFPGSAVMLFEARGNHWNAAATSEALETRHVDGTRGRVLYVSGATQAVPRPSQPEVARWVNGR